MVEPSDDECRVDTLGSREAPNGLKGEMGCVCIHEFIKGLLGQKPLRGQAVGPALFPSGGVLIKVVIEVVLSVLRITAQVS